MKYNLVNEFTLPSTSQDAEHENLCTKYFQICIASNSYKQVSILSFKRDVHIQSVVTYLNLFNLAAFSRSKKWNSL